eukprot:5506258-Pyramimonas_sp.AAC.1
MARVSVPVQPQEGSRTSRASSSRTCWILSCRRRSRTRGTRPHRRWCCPRWRPARQWWTPPPARA